MTLVLAAALGATPMLVAHAQDGDSSRLAAARALFQEGVALARRGEYGDATDRFRRAQSLHPAAPISYNLASALEHQGALVEASEILERLLRDPALPRELATNVARLRERITPRLARLTLRLAGDPRGVRVELDERELPEAVIGVSIPIDPGAHALRAFRDEDEAGQSDIRLGDGESREVVLTLTAPPPLAREVPREAIVARPEPAPPSRDEAPAQGDDGVAIGVGIGIAVLVVGAATIAGVVLTTPAAPAPVGGSAMPGVLTW